MFGRDQLSAGLREGRRTGALQLLVALLVPIPFMLVAHQLYFWDVGPFESARWAVNSDRSFIEILGYLQLLSAATLLSVVGGRHRRGPVYAGWAITLVVVVLDDSLGLHERGGAWLKHRDLVPSPFGLPPQELGELATWALLGVPILFLLWGTHRGSYPVARRDSWWLAGLTGVLMAFAVGVDLMHEVIEELTDNSVVDLLATFVEAGGEVGAMSALLAYVVHVARRDGSPGTTAPLGGKWPSAPGTR
ncbi:hypothetical protein SAMN05661080_04223 [Modestobacter sp. DSM 44400]|uniref:hypothetical protein n=1 Tax=Modestobacter sp. DSM 44400 TaxID=1550230 RepID=UPI0008958A2C|nr:hypothetical protein [Modestobacter sp. DSM 44400]SDY66826.1 hypothetical protein SAMN05661080_04223 [Modestobacter sp. DSM 44400]